jgi:hypothetical protein
MRLRVRWVHSHDIAQRVEKFDSLERMTLLNVQVGADCGPTIFGRTSYRSGLLRRVERMNRPDDHGAAAVRIGDYIRR